MFENIVHILSLIHILPQAKSTTAKITRTALRLHIFAESEANTDVYKRQVAHVSYAFTDVAAIYPITPSSVMADLTDKFSAPVSYTHLGAGDGLRAGLRSCL